MIMYAYFYLDARACVRACVRACGCVSVFVPVCLLPFMEYIYPLLELQVASTYVFLFYWLIDVVTSTSTATNLDIMVVTTTAASGADNSQQSQDPSAEKELGASAGSRVTDDKLYFTIAIVGSAVAVILAIFVFVLLAYIRRRTSAVAVVARKYS